MRMRTLHTLALIAVVFIPQSAFGDASSLVGTWQITVFQDDGRDRLSRLGAGAPRKNETEPRTAKLVFTSNQCFILRGDGRREMASGLANAGWKSCKLDTTTDPMSIDITGFAGKNNEKTKTYLGIYKVDGDVVTICYCEQGNQRPTKFESNGAMNLIEAKRVSDDPAPLPKQESR